MSPISTILLRCRLAFLLAALAFIGEAAAAETSICKPILAIGNVGFSSTHPETLIRTWTATVRVDASRCASTSGHFEIMFTRQKENAPEIDFTERFEWKPGSVEVSAEFWADEAVEGYRATAIAECPCRR